MTSQSRDLRAGDGLDATMTPSTWSPAQGPLVSATPPLEPGTVIGNFEVRRLLGQGGMGRVYLARDRRLGRLVALKLLRPDLVSPERVRRFLDEARLTARFSHQHIVGIHELGEHGGQPFLALEYLDGQSLRERAGGLRVPPAEAARWMLAVSRALEAAHAHQTIHCDLKPENVVLPSDGRVRVVDFGLARAASLASHGAHAGTPPYMSPEQFDGDLVDSHTDIWSLGVVLLELLTGHNPFREGASREVIEAVLSAPPESDAFGLDGAPLPLARLVRDCLRKEPTERPSATQVAELLDRFLDDRLDVDGRGQVQVECPFPGLVPFEERHAASFHGRTEEIDAFLERLRVQPILPVIGPSGAGKSSFVRAGVIPRLRAQEPWRIVGLRPGAAPLHALATRLLGLDHDATLESGIEVDSARLGPLKQELAANPRGLVMALLDASRRTRSKVLLFVDQLEEVFTHVESLEEQRAFLQALVTAADETTENLRVIFTARDDFLGRLAEVPEVQKALERVTVLRRLRPAELRAVLTRPLERVGYGWDDPSVVDDILDELAGEAAGLPLLQFACRSLWERRDEPRRLLLRSAYRAMGGVGGALAEHGEAILGGLTPAQLSAARALLLRLVGADGTRRVVPRSQAMQGLGGDGEAVLDRLSGARLITSRRAVSAPGEPVLELAHESLIRSWAALARWIADSREERALLTELEQAAGLWEGRGRRAEETWPGDAVAVARRDLLRLSVTPPPAVEAFLAAGEERAQRRRRLRRGAVIAGFVIITSLAVGSGLAAVAFAEKERLAREHAQQIDLATADIGAFGLTLVPFDLDHRGQRAVPVLPEDLPDLRVTIHMPDIDDPTTPGGPLRHRGHTQVRLAAPGWHEAIEARSGSAWLRFDGRGRRGEECGPSWLFVRRLPGYAERSNATTLRIPVPTCAATRAGVIEIPEGPYLRGGPGEPPLRKSALVDPEVEVRVGSYGLDRTEVPNWLYEQWAALAPVTGYEPPEHPHSGQLEFAGAPEHPATQIDAFSAEQLCMFLGRRLPTSVEWEKAARGGLTLPSGPNPAPRRNAPWADGPVAANLDGDADGWAATAPVGSMPEGAGPYGHLHLSGNVSEWTATPESGSRFGLRVIRGGDWATPLAEEVHTLAYENTRPPRLSATFSLGVRCAL